MDPQTLTDAVPSEAATGAVLPVETPERIEDTGDIPTGPAEEAIDAVAPVHSVENLIAMVMHGGPVVWLLLGFSLLALTVIFVKLGQLLALRQQPGHSVETAMARLQADQPGEAHRLVNGQANTRAQVLSRALDMHDSGQYSVTEIRDEATRVARLGLARQESHLRILEVIAVLAPLLGLFGTVLGMIEAFRAMESAGSQVNPAILSGGIWQALLTTAFGLAVAIPVSIAHSWFERKLEVLGTHLQNDIDLLTSTISHVNRQKTTATLIRQPLHRAVS